VQQQQADAGVGASQAKKRSRSSIPMPDPAAAAAADAQAAAAAAAGDDGSGADAAGVRRTSRANAGKRSKDAIDILFTQGECGGHATDCTWCAGVNAALVIASSSAVLLHQLR
jgi:hypothetical protein